MLNDSNDMRKNTNKNVTNIAKNDTMMDILNIIKNIVRIIDTNLMLKRENFVSTIQKKSKNTTKREKKNIKIGTMMDMIKRREKNIIDNIIELTHHIIENDIEERKQKKREENMMVEENNNILASMEIGEMVSYIIKVLDENNEPMDFNIYYEKYFKRFDDEEAEAKRERKKLYNKEYRRRKKEEERR